MADGDNSGDGNEDGGRSLKKLIILLIVGLVIVAISVGGTLMALKFLKGQEPAERALEEENADDAGTPKPPVAPAIYYPLKPPIIVNFEVKGRQRYLQAEIVLLIREDDVISAIELHMPMLRNSLIMLIGGQRYEEIQTAEGKELLRQQCLQEMQKIMEAEIGKPGIEQVLFASLVMQ